MIHSHLLVIIHHAEGSIALPQPPSICSDLIPQGFKTIIQQLQIRVLYGRQWVADGQWPCKVHLADALCLRSAAHSVMCL